MLAIDASAAMQISENNIEIGVVNDQKMFRVLTPAEILDYLGEVE